MNLDEEAANLVRYQQAYAASAQVMKAADDLFQTLLGITGSGKSAQLLYLVMSALALHGPRVTLIEAGNSFGLLVTWLARAGYRTHSVRIQPSSPISICPFLQAQMLLLARRGRLTPTLDDGLDESIDLDSDDENRDLLGEMELAALIMITGGEEVEAARMSRADRFRLREAILLAAEHSRSTMARLAAATGEITAVAGLIGYLLVFQNCRGGVVLQEFVDRLQALAEVDAGEIEVMPSRTCFAAWGTRFANSATASRCSNPLWMRRAPGSGRS